MIVVQCPDCKSRFKVEKSTLPDRPVKMRCSVCSRVFTYSPGEEVAGEQSFDSVIGTRDDSLERSLSAASLQNDLTGDITESSGEETTRTDPSNFEVQPESVIREIDSILGSGEEISDGSEPEAKSRSGKRTTLGMIVSVTLVVLIFLGVGLWIMRDQIPFFRQGAGTIENSVLERGPFFTIPQESISYELLTNNSEGSVLVVKGVIEKLTSKPLKSILVQARVYDRDNNLIESRNAFAGVIPESVEFARQKGSDIDTLLSAEPRSLGVFATSSDIPFAVAFFGRAAQDGFSFQVEVKEFHWD